MDVDLRVWECECECECEEGKFEGGARNGDGCGWPTNCCCGREGRREGGGWVLGVMLGTRGVVEAWAMLG